jgi:hypothetical protein
LAGIVLDMYRTAATQRWSYRLAELANGFGLYSTRLGSLGEFYESDEGRSFAQSLVFPLERTLLHVQMLATAATRFACNCLCCVQTKLNPLKVVQREVVYEFARITRELGFMNLDTILQNVSFCSFCSFCSVASFHFPPADVHLAIRRLHLDLPCSEHQQR